MEKHQIRIKIKIPYSSTGPNMSYFLRDHFLFYVFHKKILIALFTRAFTLMGSVCFVNFLLHFDHVLKL